MLRALHEAGVKIDVVAGRGVGVVGALFAAVDGAQRLWDDNGLLAVAGGRDVLSLASDAARARLGRWRRRRDRRGAARRDGGGADRLSDRLRLEDARPGPAGGLTGAYLRFAEAALAPTALPTWLPRLALLVLWGGRGRGGLVGAAARATGGTSADRSGGVLVPAPLSAEPAIDPLLEGALGSGARRGTGRSSRRPPIWRGATPSC